MFLRGRRNRSGFSHFFSSHSAKPFMMSLHSLFRSSRLLCSRPNRSLSCLVGHCSGRDSSRRAVFSSTSCSHRTHVSVLWDLDNVSPLEFSRQSVGEYSKPILTAAKALGDVNARYCVCRMCVLCVCVLYMCALLTWPHLVQQGCRRLCQSPNTSMAWR